MLYRNKSSFMEGKSFGGRGGLYLSEEKNVTRKQKREGTVLHSRWAREKLPLLFSKGITLLLPEKGERMVGGKKNRREIEQEVSGISKKTGFFNSIERKKGKQNDQVSKHDNKPATSGEIKKKRLHNHGQGKGEGHEGPKI